MTKSAEVNAGMHARRWVPSSFLQFWLVPERYQVLWVSGVSFGWNIYLSLLYHSARRSKDARDVVL